MSPPDSLEVPFTEEEVRLEYFLWVDPFPDDIQLAVLDQGNDEGPSVDFVEVDVEVEIVLAMAGKKLPNCTCFVGVAQDAVEKVTELYVKIFRGGVFFDCEVLDCFAEERLAAAGCQLAHYELLLKFGMNVGVNMPQISHIDPSAVQELTQFPRTEKVDLKGVYLLYHS